MELKVLFQKAYDMMDEPIIDGNCGELCNFHCCRSHSEKERMGMYLIPHEFKMMQNFHVDYEVHTKHLYDMPKGVKRLYYIFCPDDSGCLRQKRPIQCRTYPFEPHYEEDVLTLVVEKEQIHQCPLLNKTEIWRKEFIEGVLRGWQLLCTVDEIKAFVKTYSDIRVEKENVLMKLNLETMQVENVE
ncbi:MAG: hypothetical protein JXR88_16785 [Clostridia bacterium]|nr:hypothetical protein [Clostridia bacterium]